MYITMAYELIHALHAVNGEFLHPEEYKGSYYSLDTDTLTGLESMEEILTTGFDYVDENGQRIKSCFVVTENAIREENGLELRVTY